MQIAREPRRKVTIRASMRAEGPPLDVCVRDISSRGLMIQTRVPPPRGTYVQIECAGHEIVGIVVWRREHRFGINTCERIDASALARERQPAKASPRPAKSVGKAGIAASVTPQGRMFAQRMEFAVVATFALVLVGALGAVAFETLSRPLAAVSAALGGEPVP